MFSALGSAFYFGFVSNLEENLILAGTNLGLSKPQTRLYLDDTISLVASLLGGSIFAFPNSVIPLQTFIFVDKTSGLP